MMLLPVGYYMTGGALAVLLSFLLLAAVPGRWLAGKGVPALAFAPAVTVPKAPVSLLALAVLAVCVVSGFVSTGDPLTNPLPLVIWTGWWVGFTLAQAVFGNLWPWFNPWSGLLALMRRVSGGDVGLRPLVALPVRLGYGLAILQFAVFAWFELVSIAPEDPPRLAQAVLLYWAVNLAAMIVFGEAEWTKRGEPFSVFFRMIGLFAPFFTMRTPQGPKLALTWPGLRCREADPMPVSGTLLILLTLGTASFDGFSETFTWFDLIGRNPLEFAGRSSVTLPNSLGLYAAAAMLGLLFYGAVAAGAALAGGSLSDVQPLAGRLIYSIIPISIAFHGAHYLTMLLINGQYLAAMLSDPFLRGWDLFGTAHWHVTTSFLQHLEGVRMIWIAQTAVIVTGHVVGILVAHMIALDYFGKAGAAARSQLFLAAAMVFYTVFGLWLLSTPSIG
ncbi:hypothetical protein NOF55_12745 [Rhizobiaceae bacterium BDR2-2]|uniref:Fenitrothion hydrolase n=1 Tax=Ectorhizobium quercum TaxID=2965071 RepID=A0AAE3N0P0_9HYPH|nr:hypothetical protein [Ectorhizobium quercum]MCX8997971.1 hypothetical protein [Ectorhizobium quercum]